MGRNVINLEEKKEELNKEETAMETKDMTTDSKEKNGAAGWFKRLGAVGKTVVIGGAGLLVTGIAIGVKVLISALSGGDDDTDENTCESEAPQDE